MLYVITTYLCQSAAINNFPKSPVLDYFLKKLPPRVTHPVGFFFKLRYDDVIVFSCLTTRTIPPFCCLLKNNCGDIRTYHN